MSMFARASLAAASRRTAAAVPVRLARRWASTETFKYKATTPEEAVRAVKSGDNVFIHTAAMCPPALVKALAARHNELEAVKLYHLHVEWPEGELPFVKKEYSRAFTDFGFFTGHCTRKAVVEGRGEYIPVFLGEIAQLFEKRVIPLDVAMLSVSPPDAHGFCSLGTSVDVSLDALNHSARVIGQINKNVPRTHGASLVHISRFHSVCEVDSPIPTVPRGAVEQAERQIGANIAEMIPNGACLQMGIGSIPDAVLAELTGHKRLGVHTEMFSSGLVNLVQAGVITGEEKHESGLYQVIASFANGDAAMFDWIHDNPFVQFRPSAWVNDPKVIKLNKNMIAINSCIEMDLSGQVCADSIGSRIFSGVGGQMDFMRGASLSEGGKPIIAITSTTGNGTSRIMPFLKPGAGVVTTRAHLRYVVTEYGVAELWGRSLTQRAKALIAIAHPDHRPALEYALKNQYWTMEPSQLTSKMVADLGPLMSDLGHYHTPAAKK